MDSGNVISITVVVIIIIISFMSITNYRQDFEAESEPMLKGLLGT